MEVNICGLPYQIQYVSDPIHVSHNADSLDLYGEINYIKQSIRVLDTGGEDYKRRVLMHEIVHGIVQHMAIRELIDDSGRHLETPIDQLATGLCMALESLGFLLPTSNSVSYFSPAANQCSKG